ncbi:MAG: hypothetical protein HUJ84_04770 [Veillonella sp.]|nr:hypothetical protein [Veillonella sp.]
MFRNAREKFRRYIFHLRFESWNILDLFRVIWGLIAILFVIFVLTLHIAMMLIYGPTERQREEKQNILVTNIKRIVPTDTIDEVVRKKFITRTVYLDGKTIKGMFEFYSIIESEIMSEGFYKYNSHKWVDNGTRVTHLYSNGDYLVEVTYWDGGEWSIIITTITTALDYGM